jgi:hypothetical protein
MNGLIRTFARLREQVDRSPGRGLGRVGRFRNGSNTASMRGNPPPESTVSVGRELRRWQRRRAFFGCSKMDLGDVAGGRDPRCFVPCEI